MAGATVAPPRRPEKTTAAVTRPRSRLWLLALLVVALLCAATLWGLARLGAWLVIEDSLAPADAIVVLSGRMPARAIEAAELYRQGLAREVWLTHTVVVEEQMRRLGLPYVGEDGYNRMVLERLGVPPQAIRVLPDSVLNTQQEVLAISRALRQGGGARVILVTSMPHTRRVRTIWKKLVGERPQAIVRYTRADPFDSAHWWRNTGEALDVVRETLGLANAWAGFPIGASSR